MSELATTTAGASLALGLVGPGWLYSASAVWSLLSFLAWFVAALHLVMTVCVWGATLRTLGLSSLLRCPRVLRLSLRGSQIRQLSVALLLPFLAAPLVTALGVGGGLIAKLPWGALTMIASLTLTLYFIPPAVLVLSSSTDRQVRWALALKRFTGGLRVVSLLDTGYVAVEPRVNDLWSVTLRKSATLLDVLRTSGTEGWEEGVRELIDIAPVVVVDARLRTRALLYEACAALAPSNAHKAVFVVEDDGSCPLLEGLLAEGRVTPRTTLSVTTESEVGPLLTKLVASPDALPKPGSFVSARTTIVETVSRATRRRREFYPARRSDNGATEASGPDSCRRLSTALTPFWRLMTAGAAGNLILTATLGPLLLLTLPTTSLSGFGKSLLWALLACNWLGSAVYFYLARSLTEVRLRGDTILIADRAKRCEVHLSQVSSVTGPDWTTLRRITLHLRDPSPFGQTIVFAGRLLSAGSDARELGRRLYSYAEGESASLSRG